MATRSRPRRAAPAAGTDTPAADAAPATAPADTPRPKRPPRKTATRAAAPPEPVAPAAADAAPAAESPATPAAKAPPRRTAANKDAVKKASAGKPAHKPADNAAVEAADKTVATVAEKAAAKPVVDATVAKTPPARKAAGKTAADTANTAATTATSAARKTAPKAAPKTAAKTPGPKAPAKKRAVQPALPAADSAPPAPVEATAASSLPAEPAKAPRRRGKAAPVADEAAVDTPAAPPAPVAPAPPLLPYSAVHLVDGDERRLRWVAGAGCPDALHEAAAAFADADGFLRVDDDDALPTLLRVADEAGHALQVEPAAWLQLAHSRDARHRLHQLETSYPEGPTSPALQALLRAPLAPFQAEGALFATCAGRALIADERGLGKTVQALAAAVLLHRHAGVHRVLLRCAPARRLSWQREWARFVRETDLELRIGDALTDGWTPDLVLIDEPQRLERWEAIDAPFALVLCGADLAAQPALLDALVRFLDCHRQGPLARLVQHGAAALDDGLQTLLLRRRRREVAAQLPHGVQSERVLAMEAPQRAAHDRALAEARARLAGWRRSGRLSDAEQWQLGVALQAARVACHRAEPGQADSPLAEATLTALQDLLGELRTTPGLRIALVCPTAADRTQLERRLGVAGRLALVLDGAALPAVDLVVRIGTPWRPQATPGQCVHLVADASLDAGLFDTLALRADVPCGPVEGGREGFLQGARLQRYLLAAEAALNAAG